MEILYVDETCTNFETRQSEHENPNHNLEPAQHIAKHKQHSFEWKILRECPLIPSGTWHMMKNRISSYFVQS